MTRTEVLKKLRDLGTAQNRKVYARHGVEGPQFGVSFAHQRALARKIGHDQPLAEALWDSRNFDARITATLIADPEAVSKTTLNQWARETDCYPLAHELAKLTARTPHSLDRLEQWRKTRNDLTACVGWHLVAVLASEDGIRTESAFTADLRQIEAGLKRAGNRTRYSMNTALIAIGARSARLQTKAMATARRIGKVEVDHGETGCKTPDALVAIPKAAARRKARASRPARR